METSPPGRTSQIWLRGFHSHKEVFPTRIHMEEHRKRLFPVSSSYNTAMIHSDATSCQPASDHTKLLSALTGADLGGGGLQKEPKQEASWRGSSIWETWSNAQSCEKLHADVLKCSVELWLVKWIWNSQYEINLQQCMEQNEVKVIHLIQSIIKVRNACVWLLHSTLILKGFSATESTLCVSDEFLSNVKASPRLSVRGVLVLLHCCRKPSISAGVGGVKPRAGDIQHPDLQPAPQLGLLVKIPIFPLSRSKTFGCSSSTVPPRTSGAPEHQNDLPSNMMADE